MDFINKKAPRDFAEPTMLPRDAQQQETWQELNRKWWQQNPMRYDWREGLGYQEFSKEFYQEIDRRFFSDVREYMPWKRIPFDPLIDFDRLKSQDMLEIGVGSGSHAALLAQHAKSYTGIDLTDYAVKSTSTRL